MNAVRIRKIIESETLHLPELKPLIGKTVEIIVLEEPASAIIPGTGDWDSAMKAVAELENYDFDAYRRQREYDPARQGSSAMTWVDASVLIDFLKKHKGDAARIACQPATPRSSHCRRRPLRHNRRPTPPLLSV